MSAIRWRLMWSFLQHSFLLISENAKLPWNAVSDGPREDSIDSAGVFAGHGIITNYPQRLEERPATICRHLTFFMVHYSRITYS